MTSISVLPSTSDLPVSIPMNSTGGAWLEINDDTNCQTLSVDELLWQCTQNSTDHAWTEFIQRFDRLIASIVSRICREWARTSPELVEDLIQETYLKLCAKGYSLLLNFQSRHPNAFLGYIKTVTTNVVYDHFRSARAFKRDVGKNVDLDHAMNYLQTGQGQAESLENTILLSEIDNLLQHRGAGPAEERDRKIFWFYYRDGLTAKAIASTSGIDLTVKSVEGIIARLTRFVKKSLARQFQGECRSPAFFTPRLKPNATYFAARTFRNVRGGGSN